MKGSKKRGGHKPPKIEDEGFSGIYGNAIYEPSDSEDDYSQQEKMLLDKVRSRPTQSKVPKKLAVMDLPSSDDDDDDDDGNNYEDDDQEEADSIDDGNMDSDIEGKEDDLNLPDQRAWGKSKKNYYNTNFVDQDYGGFDGDDATAAELEEQEAREIQKRLAAELDDNDFTLDVFTKSKDDEKVATKPSEEIIKTDLSQLSSRQKLALLQKEAPELVGIISEFRDAMEELKTRLQPAIELVQRNQVPSPQLIQYIRTKYHLVNNYVMNMGFYLLLRARRLPVSAHPVVKRLLQYRQLLQQLEPLEVVTANQLEELLNAADSGSLPVVDVNGVSPRKQNKKPLQLLSLPKATESEELDSSDSDLESNEPDELKIKRTTSKNDKVEKSSKKESKKKDLKMPWENALESEEHKGLPWATGFGSENGDNDSDDDMDVSGAQDGAEDDVDEDGNSKRGITWQIAKNKGLTPHRKKELRNPRVKHRNKFRKAKIRRKGQVREARTEVQRYGGEVSGIKKTVTKSVKIK